MILSATPIASRINGTGINAAAECMTTKACFPVAMIYCPVVGMTFRGGFSDDFWIQMSVRTKAGYESNLSPLPWNLSPYLCPQAQQRYTLSLSTRLWVHFHAVPGSRCASERWQNINRSSHRPLGIRLQTSVLHRGTLLRRRDDLQFTSRLILKQLIVKKFVQIWFDAHFLPRFSSWLLAWTENARKNIQTTEFESKVLQPSRVMVRVTGIAWRHA